MKRNIRDYRVNESNQAKAAEKGLVEADWYRSPVDNAQLNALLERRNFPALRDTFIWLGLLILSGVAGAALWPSPLAILPFMLYGIIYATSSDSRWHECSHGTAFKTDWMNVALYEIASFMVVRESTVWRWSHFRHHSDTLVVGSDPEIAAQRPMSFFTLLLFFTAIPSTFNTFKSILLHARGGLSDAEKLFIPQEEHKKVFFKARIYLAIYITVIALACLLNSWLPLMFIGLPTLYGSWLMPIYGLTQHTGLTENQLDHRLNCRTVYMNLVNRFLYWNMGYHVEHHMFPMVPYYNLPKLHALMKKDCPQPYPSILSAWKEIIPAIKRQQHDLTYFIQRELPKTARPSDYRQDSIAHFSIGNVDKDGWIQVNAEKPVPESALRFDHNNQSFAIYCTRSGALYATDGYCTHGHTHLADGLVCGNHIECPKHNGRFSVIDGSCQRQPVTIPLNSYPVKEQTDGTLWFKLPSQEQSNLTKLNFTVVRNKHLTAFIKELVLTPDDKSFSFQAGDFMQLEIPSYPLISVDDFDIPATYARAWQQAVTSNVSVSHQKAESCHAEKRNYSIAFSTQSSGQIHFNVRIALPPTGTQHPMGIGSAYVFQLKPKDKVTAFGPTGAFHIKRSQKEMIYIGGGAGMAPIRAHISQLFDNEATQRKVSFWYGARSEQDIFYQDYFSGLAHKHPNFDYCLALSALEQDNNWKGEKGFIHEVLEKNYLSMHPCPEQVEFYLCGPPLMVDAVEKLLKKYRVPKHAICYDIF